VKALAFALISFFSAPAAHGADSSLARTIDRAIDQPAFAAATWGIEVRSLKNGKVLYARNARKNMKPASTLKLVTTAAALDAFGPDDRLRTTLETAGRLDGLGRILGDVYFVGRGDPNLSGRFANGRATAAFEELADHLVAAGVRRIEGRLVGHEGLFRGERRGEDWSWGDLVWWYGAEVAALAFNDNCADIRVGPGERVGDPILVDASPVSSYYTVVSTATTAATGAKKDDLILERAAGANLIRISGTLPFGQAPTELNVALEDPARYATTVLSEVLAAKGIRVAGGVVTSAAALPSGLRVLALHDGPPLAEVLKGVNKPSQNLHAEMLLRLLGARLKADGSVEGGQVAVREFLKRIGVEPEEGTLQDGSGLSRSDLLTPHDLVSLLAAMDRHRYAQAFRDSLPIAGVDGSLRNRMKGTPAERRIVAKTGGLRHVAALAGYATTKAGERLAFAIVVNHHTAKGPEVSATIDQLAQALAR
jgi:D-alanyl-D-alanine carboxypeptidase/D-alanyl-D-alanine-endopeptidase (penicillin-binding protein 4)